ncbi:MAG: hypothetical protein ACMUIU_05195 [bacterium]
MNLNIKDFPSDVYRKLRLMAEKDGKKIEEVIVAAINNYFEEKEIEYRKSLLNIEQDRCFTKEDEFD